MDVDGRGDQHVPRSPGGVRSGKTTSRQVAAIPNVLECHHGLHDEREPGSDHDQLGIAAAVRPQRLLQADGGADHPARDRDGARAVRLRVQDSTPRAGCSSGRRRRTSSAPWRMPRASTSTGSGAAGSTPPITSTWRSAACASIACRPRIRRSSSRFSASAGARRQPDPLTVTQQSCPGAAELCRASSRREGLLQRERRVRGHQQGPQRLPRPSTEGLKEPDKSAFERALRDNPYIYFMDFENVGGLVSALPLKFTFEDGSDKEELDPGRDLAGEQRRR